MLNLGQLQVSYFASVTCVSKRGFVMLLLWTLLRTFYLSDCSSAGSHKVLVSKLSMHV